MQALVKNVVHPLLVAALGWLFGLRGLPLQVMVVAAALPIGANVFLFSQRYRTAEGLVTASVAVSTVLALVTVSVVMALSNRLSGRQAFAHPGAVFAPVAQPVMQPALAALPELPAVGHQAEAAPVRRARRREQVPGGLARRRSSPARRGR